MRHRTVDWNVFDDAVRGVRVALEQKHIGYEGAGHCKGLQEPPRGSDQWYIYLRSGSDGKKTRGGVTTQIKGMHTTTPLRVNHDLKTKDRTAQELYLQYDSAGDRSDIMHRFKVLTLHSSEINRLQFEPVEMTK